MDNNVLKDLVSPKTFLKVNIDNLPDNIENIFVKKIIVNNYSHFEKIYSRIFDYVPSSPNSNFENLRDVYLTRILRYLLNIHLLYSRGTKEHDIQLRNALVHLKSSSFRAFEQVMKFKVYGIMYVKKWYHRNAIGKLMNLLLRVYL